MCRVIPSKDGWIVTVAFAFLFFLLLFWWCACSPRVREFPATGETKEYVCLHEVVDTTFLCPCALTSDVETSFYFQEKSFVFSLGFLSSHPGVCRSFPPFCSPF